MRAARVQNVETYEHVFSEANTLQGKLNYKNGLNHKI